MESKETPHRGQPQAEQPSPNEAGLLTNAARAVGAAIGKVRSTLGLARAPDPAERPLSKPVSRKKSSAKKKQAPSARKATAKKAGDGKPSKPAKKR